MIELPASTLFNKRVPKQRFYGNLSVTPELKRVFTEQISTIRWRNKLAPSTMNIAEGEKVLELQIFHVLLNQKSVDQRVLQLMDREIPYHILFLLEYDQMLQAWIAYKEASQSKSGAFVVVKYYHSDWQPKEALNLSLEGLNLDAVYENFIRQIAGERLEAPSDTEKTSDESLADAVERDQARQKLQKQIDRLQKKVYKEKQFNKQVELNNKLRELKKILREINE